MSLCLIIDEMHPTLLPLLAGVGVVSKAMSGELFDKRAEQLGVAQFVELTNLVAANPVA